MTSDRGNSGAAELQLTPTSVTQKSPGLNPNATEFLSKQDVHHWDDINADGLYQYANGDINKLEASSGVFSPAAASEPPLQPISADFTPAATVTGPVPLLPVSPAPPPAAAADQTVSTVNTGPAAAAAGGGGVAGTGSAGAGTIIGTTGIPTTSSPLIYSTQTETATLQDESPAQVDGTLSDEQIRRMLKSQLEYYFSRENLTSDTYLMSQMDADQYVAISAVASFSQVQRLTSNLDLVVDVLRECQNVQVDEKGEKVRPNHNRCIVILREIPATTPVEEVENLFSGNNCPKFVSCEFAHNDSWYVTFDSDEDAQRAYQYLREEVKSFLGKPIMARIKAKPLIRPSYVPRNGLKPHFEQQTFPSPQRYAFLPNLQYGQQVFYHPGHAVLSSWAPAAPTIMDPSMQVFAMNGYQAAGVKLNPPGRHQFTNIRVSRTQKPHRLNQERASSDSRLSHDRHQNPNAHRSSPRSTENAHVATAPFLQRKSSDNSSHHNHPLHHIQQHSSNTGSGVGAGIGGGSSSNTGGGGGGLTATVPVHHSSAAAESSASMNVSLLSDSTKDSPASQPQRKLYNKGRRKKDEDYSKLSRQNSSQISANNKYTEPQFEFESNSFPPLPGSQNNAASGEKFENKLSDVVRGTAKPLAKESVIASPVVAATASSSTSSPSSSTTGAPATGTNAAAVVVAAAAPPMSASSSSASPSSSAAVGLNTQAPLPAPPPLQSSASKEVSSAVASSMLAPSSASAVVSSSLALAPAPAVAPSATAAPASHLPLIATTSTLSSSASATSANNRTLAQTSQPVCPANKSSCVIPSTTGKLNSVNPVDHSKSADSHSGSQVGGSQSHPVAVVTSPPTAAAAVATTTASPKEAGVGSATLTATSSAHTPPASSSQSLSVSSLPLSSLSSSGHGLQAPPASGALSSSSSSTQQGHSRPGQQQAAAPQGMMTSSAGASSSSAALTATSVSSTLALQQQQQNAKVSAMEERSTSKLSYAQMVARKRDPGNDGGSSMSSSDKSQGPVSPQTSSAALQLQQQVHSGGAGEASMCKMMPNNLLQPTSSGPSQRSQALKEQSQALKVSSPSATHSQLPPKEHILRKDLEPKEQRFNLSGRRPAKENRERQRRKTDRERTSK